MSQPDFSREIQENEPARRCSVDTGRFNFMNVNVPLAATENAQTSEFMKERDYFTREEKDKDREINEKLYTMKLPSTSNDDFFQLWSRNQSESIALEPAEGDFARQEPSSELFPPSNHIDLFRHTEQRSDDSSNAANQVCIQNFDLPLGVLPTQETLKFFPTICSTPSVAARTLTSPSIARVASRAYRMDLTSLFMPETLCP
jgi:hypothetical protein